MNEIIINYDGGFPNLCSGDLSVEINGELWRFPDYCLHSGGGVTFDENWSEEISLGNWIIDEWPEGFPEELREEVLERINEEIPQGCCGGCV